jgi:hypothetical protein
MSTPDDGWRSRRGTFTLVRDLRSSGLVSQEISEKLAIAIRAYNGFLYDREAFAIDQAKEWSKKLDQGKFVQLGKLSIFVLVRKGEE